MIVVQFFRMGAHKRTGSVGTEQDFTVERIINHHSYKRPYGLAHDIAMLKLRKSAVLNRAVNLACLPGSGGSVADGKTCWVTGISSDAMAVLTKTQLRQSDIT